MARNLKQEAAGKPTYHSGLPDGSPAEKIREFCKCIGKVFRARQNTLAIQVFAGQFPQILPQSDRSNCNV
jgi:hypothetical protein